MASQYASARALAQRLIGKRGRKASIYRTKDGVAPDPSKPWRPGASRDKTVPSSIPMVFLDYSVQEDASRAGLAFAASVGKALVPEATQTAYVAALDMTERPRAGDRIKDGSKRLEVLELEVLQPGEDDILYVLYMKE